VLYGIKLHAELVADVENFPMDNVMTCSIVSKRIIDLIMAIMYYWYIIHNPLANEICMRIENERCLPRDEMDRQKRTPIKKKEEEHKAKAFDHPESVCLVGA